jgi:hypothetical protein
MRSLRASTETRRGRGCILLFAIFWLAFSLLWTFLAWRGSGGLAWLFGVPFIAIGLVLIVVSLWRTVSAIKVAPPQVSVSKTQLRPGESFSVSYVQRFRLPTTLQDCRVELVFRESATYTQGTDTRTDTHDKVMSFFDGPAGSFEAGSEVRRDGNFQIPVDAMHSFESQNNKLQWLVRVHVDVQEWPDMIEAYDLTVLPERSLI